MDSKLELFLSKLNLPKEDYNYFNEGKILKIKSTKDKLNWDFIIETKELKPIEIKYLKVIEQDTKVNIVKKRFICHKCKKIYRAFRFK